MTTWTCSVCNLSRTVEQACCGIAMEPLEITAIRTELTTLRGLLREACEYEVWISDGEREYAMSTDWRKRVTAALEGKQ